MERNTQLLIAALIKITSKHEKGITPEMIRWADTVLLFLTGDDNRNVCQVFKDWESESARLTQAY